MTTTTNSWTSQLATRPSLDAEMAKAKTSHHNAKTQALETVVSLYGLYLATMAPNARKEGQKWLKDQIDAANIAIDTLNDAKKKGEERLMRVEARDKASKFTVLVKLALDVRAPDEASIVSRYCKALEAIDEEYAGKQIGAPQEITAWGTAKGGFEALVLLGRGNETPKAKPTIESDAAVSVVAEAIKTEALLRGSMAQFEAPSETREGFVLALGRQKDGSIEIVSSSPLPDDDAWVSFFERDLGPKLDPTTEFIARVQALGHLVEEGRQTDHTVNGVGGASKLKEERALTIIPEAGMQPMLLVSAQHAKASIIVKARPTASTIKLGAQTDAAVMKRECLGVLQTTLGGKYAAHMVSITTSTGKDGLPIWKTQPSTLSKTTAVAEYLWDLAECLIHPPLDVRGFTPQFSAELQFSDLVRLHDERLKVWEAKEKAAKAAAKANAPGTAQKKSKAQGVKKRIGLTFEVGTLTYSMSHDAGLVLPISGSIKKAVSLTFRPFDLLRVAAQLRKQDTLTFTLEGDSGGLLRFHWADTLGNYDVYLPTATEGSGLESKLVDALRIEAKAEAEAA